jgi:O-glycosyl hydrolase
MFFYDANFIFKLFSDFMYIFFYSYGNSGSNQIGLTIIRLRIDPNKDWAAELSNAKKATARGAKVMATAWTPPASMKTNNNVAGGELKTRHVLILNC